jgi:hypothetical protein
MKGDIVNNFYLTRILLLVFAVSLLPQCQKNKIIPSKTQTSSAVVLKDGELYEISSDKVGSKVTSANGNVKSYLMTPDRRYVAYSVFVGFYNVVGLDGSGDLRPVHHIIVMDLDRKKQLTEIKPQSENEPFIYTDHWISNDELLLQEADGFATGYNYIYRISNNELRIANSGIEEDLNSEETGS